MEDNKNTAKKKCTGTQDLTGKTEMLERKMEKLLQRMTALEKRSICQCQCKASNQTAKPRTGKSPTVVDNQNSCLPPDQLEKLCNAIEANTRVHEGRREDKNRLNPMQTMTSWPVLIN